MINWGSSRAWHFPGDSWPGRMTMTSSFTSNAHGKLTIFPESKKIILNFVLEIILNSQKFIPSR